jgi:hypothetical protein
MFHINEQIYFKHIIGIPATGLSEHHVKSETVK